MLERPADAHSATRRRAPQSLLVAFLMLAGCDGTPAAPGARPPSSSLEAQREPKKTGQSKADSPTQAANESTQRTPASQLDSGIFNDLDSQVRVHCPDWLDESPSFVISDDGGGHWLGWDGMVLCHSSQWFKKKLDESFLARKRIVLDPKHNPSQDRDKDGIFDAIDILRGAKKTVLNGAHYKSTYRELAYPGGDVPRSEGVCTDVVVRSFRNFGLDLQIEVQKDIKRNPARYPMVKEPNPHIDHRRVRTLLPYFQAHAEALAPSLKGEAFPYLPGDVVFLDTMKKPGPEHLGIVSDRVGASGLPLVINNWNDGTVTTEMDLLGHVPVTHHFRAAGNLAPREHARGLPGVLARHKMDLPQETRQVLLVTTPLWSASGGRLQRWARKEGGPFKPVSAPVAVRIGRAGLGCGRGLVPDVDCESSKKEGDKKAPSGLFALGTAFGRARHPSVPMRWPYRPTTRRDFFVDDPETDLYNTWVTWGAEQAMPHSAERLSMYKWGLVVHHNFAPVEKAAGSAIFIHPWKDSQTPTVGCTALSEPDLMTVFGWLDPKEKPLLLQVVDHVF